MKMLIKISDFTKLFAMLISLCLVVNTITSSALAFSNLATPSISSLEDFNTFNKERQNQIIYERIEQNSPYLQSLYHRLGYDMNLDPFDIKGEQLLNYERQRVSHQSYKTRIKTLIGFIIAGLTFLYSGRLGGIISEIFYLLGYYQVNQPLVKPVIAAIGALVAGTLFLLLLIENDETLDIKTDNDKHILDILTKRGNEITNQVGKNQLAAISGFVLSFFSFLNTPIYYVSNSYADFINILFKTTASVKTFLAITFVAGVSGILLSLAYLKGFANTVEYEPVDEESELAALMFGYMLTFRSCPNELMDLAPKVTQKILGELQNIGVTIPIPTQLEPSETELSL